MSIYITNRDHISTSALYSPNEACLEHGLFNWGKHKYIKRTGTPGHYVYTYAEDLKKAGQRVSSGAKNLVSRASNVTRNALGANKREAVRQTRIRRDVARVAAASAKNNRNATQNLYVRQRYAPTNLPFKSMMEAHRARNRAEDREETAAKALREAQWDYEKAVSEYKKTPMGVADSIKDFMRSTVGLGQRKKIKTIEKVYRKYTLDSYDKSLTFEERRRAAESAERTRVALEASYRDYGKTMLDSLPSIRWRKGYGPVVIYKGTGYGFGFK